MMRVVLVSNRVTETGKSSQAGGVAVALLDILKTREAIWFGWSGRIDDDVAIDTSGLPVITTALTPDEHDGYYLGYANSVLWPVLHNRLDLAHFEAGHYETYRSVNRRLARNLSSILRPDDVIWVHDYHLIPLAAELRALGVANPIGFFLHVPFAPWQTFMAIPEYVRLAEGFGAYDLIGLQTEADVANLIDFLANGVNGNIIADGRIRIGSRIVRVASFPIGIDPADFAKPPPTSSAPSAGVSRIIGVDRLDYTKGLPQKFKAFGRFLAKNPEFHRKVVLTQIAPPSREMVAAYDDLRRELENTTGSINGHFGDLDWVPIHYIRRATARSKLIEIYRNSRVALVTPLRDGMNLVAKEYVAAQDPENPGVLVLSRFAGAAERMPEALIVNPYSIDDTAEAISRALRMNSTERKERHVALLRTVRENDVMRWYRSFLHVLESTSDGEIGSQELPSPFQSALMRMRGNRAVSRNVAT